MAQFVKFEQNRSFLQRELKDLAPYNPAAVHGGFGGTYYLHLQGKKILYARKLTKASNKESK
jgi:hypothetical protein